MHKENIQATTHTVIHIQYIAESSGQNDAADAALMLL